MEAIKCNSSNIPIRRGSVWYSAESINAVIFMFRKRLKCLLQEIDTGILIEVNMSY